MSSRSRRRFDSLALAVLLCACAGLPALGVEPAAPAASASQPKNASPAPQAPGQCPAGTADQITKAIAHGVTNGYKPFSANTRLLSGPGFLAECLGEQKAKKTREALQQVFAETLGTAHHGRGGVDNHEYGYANMLHDLQNAFDGSRNKGSRVTYVDFMQKQAGWWKLKPGHTASNHPADYYAVELRRNSKNELYKTGRLVEISGWGVPASRRLAYHPGKKAVARRDGKKTVARRKKVPARRAAPRRPRSQHRYARWNSPARASDGRVVLRLGYKDNGNKSGFFLRYRNGRWEQKTPNGATFHFKALKCTGGYCILQRGANNKTVQIDLPMGDGEAYIKQGTGWLALYPMRQLSLARAP